VVGLRLEGSNIHRRDRNVDAADRGRHGGRRPRLFWVGLDGNGTPTVEQVGTVAVCGKTSGTPLYYKAFWEMYTPVKADKQAAEPFPVSPGDTIMASVSYNNGSYVLELKDVTSGQYFWQPANCSASAVCQCATAEWIVERPGSGTYPLADYGEMAFYQWGYGQSSSEGPEGTLITMIDKKNGYRLSYCRFFDAPQPSGGAAAITATVGPEANPAAPHLGCTGWPQNRRTAGRTGDAISPRGGYATRGCHGIVAPTLDQLRDFS